MEVVNTKHAYNDGIVMSTLNKSYNNHTAKLICIMLLTFSSLYNSPTELNVLYPRIPQYFNDWIVPEMEIFKTTQYYKVQLQRSKKSADG